MCPVDSYGSLWINDLDLEHPKKIVRRKGRRFAQPVLGTAFIAWVLKICKDNNMAYSQLLANIAQSVLLTTVCFHCTICLPIVCILPLISLNNQYTISTIHPQHGTILLYFVCCFPTSVRSVPSAPRLNQLREVYLSLGQRNWHERMGANSKQEKREAKTM